MGFGMPAAYAAKLVHPERTVVGLVGDGCFAMTAGELTMARRLNLNVPIVVLNDGWLSLIKVKQQRRELGINGVRLGEPPPSPAHYFGVPVRGARDAGSLYGRPRLGSRAGRPERDRGVHRRRGVPGDRVRLGPSGCNRPPSNRGVPAEF